MSRDGPTVPVVASSGAAQTRALGSALRPGPRAALGVDPRLPGPGGAAPRPGAHRPVSTGAPGQRAAGRGRGADPGAPGRGPLRGDGLGQVHPAPQDLSGPGARPRRAHRSYPAPADRRAQPRQSRRPGAGRRDRWPGGLQGALPRPGAPRHQRQADDGRYPAGRDPARSPAAGIRHPDRRRGPRAQPQHRLPTGLPQAAPAPASGPQADRDLGDHRPGALRPPFRRWVRQSGAGDRDLRAHLPGGGPPPSTAGGRERGRARRAHAAGDLRGRRGAGPGGPRRRPGVSIGGAGDPGDRGDPAQASPPIDRDPAAVRPPESPGSGPGLPGPRHPSGGAGHECGGDLADGPRHPLRGRSGIRPHQPLQPPQQGPAPAGGAHLPGIRQPAPGTLWPCRLGHLHPALLAGQLRRAGPLHRARDPAHQPGRRHPADEGAGIRGHRVLPVPGPAGPPPGLRRLPDPGGAGGRRQNGRAHAAGAQAGAAPGGPAHRAHAARGGGPPLPGRGAHHRLGPEHPGPAGAPAGAPTGRGRDPWHLQPPGLGFPHLSESLGLPGAGAQGTLPEPVPQALPAPFPLVEPGAGMARRPRPAPRAARGDGVQGRRGPGDP